MSEWPAPESVKWWEPVGVGRWRCRACHDPPLPGREKRAAIRHEKTESHLRFVEASSQQFTHMEFADSTTSAIHTLLQSMITSPSINLAPSVDDESILPPLTPSSDSTGLPSNTVELGESLIDYLDDHQLSEDDQVERSVCDSEDNLFEPSANFMGPEDLNPWSIPCDDGSSNKRQRMEYLAGDAKEWYPWPNKLACTLDLLMHLPRSVFSERQLDILLWLLRVNDIENVPSVSSIKRMNKDLQSRSGVRTMEYNGALGNRYSCNSLSDIVSQEISNPRVRPHLRFYAEDNGKSVNEYFEARHWREMVPADEDRQIKLTPMVDIHGQHFFLYEPCVIRNGSVCVPYEWFRRQGKIQAMAWSMSVDTETSGWIVDETSTFEISEDEFLLSFKTWGSSTITKNYPSPTKIIG
ncbi:hypothetical protein H0H93_013288 [Arthromyces matolae]|nr:hypothetical protein H0H93_013288 [Arthromyces matolae]